MAAQHAGEPVTSDLTGEELWSLSALGFAPVKLLMSTSVYSLGAIGGLKAMFKGFVKGEISDLTTMVYDAREHNFDLGNAPMPRFELLAPRYRKRMALRLRNPRRPLATPQVLSSALPR